MEEDKKKFELPDIVILLLITIPDDVIQPLATLAIGIPFVGIAIAFLARAFHFMVCGALLLWFTMKFGFGSASMLQLGGGIAEFFGIPAQTLSVLAAIIVVNYGDRLAKMASFVAPAGEKLARAAVALAEGDKKGALKAVVSRAPSSTIPSDKILSTPSDARMRAQSSTLFAQRAPLGGASPQESQNEIPESAFGMPREPFEAIEEENFKLAA